MKKRNFISLLLLLLMVMDVALMPVRATEMLETVPQATEAPTEEVTTSQSKKLAFGTVSIHNGCRTIEASVPLGTGDRLLSTAQAVMLFETTTNTMIYSYNPDMKLAPGSLAKIVAGLVAIDEHPLALVVLAGDTYAVSVGVRSHHEVGINLLGKVECHGECLGVLRVGRDYGGEVAVLNHLLSHAVHIGETPVGQS